MKYDIVILTSTFDIGKQQKGVGYRYWDLANSLNDKGVKVALVTPGGTDFENPSVAVLDREDLTDSQIEKLSRCFIFCLLEDIKLMEKLGKNSTIIYDSILTPVEELTFQSVLEYDSSSKVDDHFKASLKKHQYFNSISDFYLVGSEEEKLLKIGELLSEGSVTGGNYHLTSQKLITMPVCGFSRKSIPNDASQSSGSTFLWNGGLWNHYTYDFILDALKLLSSTNLPFIFEFMYGNQTNAYHALSDRISKENLNFVRIPNPEAKPHDYFSKLKVLNNCKALVLLNDHTLLSDMVLPMRLREALLFKKPMIVSDNGRLGAFVKRHNIGLVCDNNAQSLFGAFESMISDKVNYEKYQDNMKLLSEYFVFDNYLEPLIAALNESRE